MAKYQQYAEYKDSGVEWLGEIPEHWISTQVKYGYTVVLGKMLQTTPKSNSDLLKPYLKAQNVQPSGIDLTNVGSMWFSADERKRLLLKEKDILVSEGGDVGRSAIWNNEIDECYIQNAINRVRPRHTNDSRFFYYWINYLKAADFISIICNKATIAHYTADKLQGSPLILPSALEQTQIANFLDYETAQIDTLIEKQKTLIQLLKEKRQAVISHAVTKGLNPDVPMKDSGVEWLGEVPEHWEVTKLKWKASTTSGGTPTTSKYEDYYEDGHIPWVRTTDLNNGKLNETPIMITPKAVRDSACSLLPKNSVLLAMYGGAGSIGKHSLLNFESTINQAVCGVLPSEAFVPDYLHRFYEFYRPFWMIGAAGTRKDPNIGQDNIKEAKTLIPPLNEQNQIADYLDKMQSHFDALTESAEKGIQLMQERRTALISAAVTGKINVRGWVKPNVEAL
ncbi:restriction endonuclease subunit S [Psychrobacter sp. TAE2020]|uniref:restriction endonuclease subunit S n=1 Tax=Psychrobacter sp. TAE2020 TaxID=2846762 RepID=UPI001C0F8262|nr:restriction endonuclease subunit S [Psychrobacter sp. TAE2020]MBU5615699.1 restriction endonuclease subunit S [Psychrobacter sp. TAE2020]